MNFRRILPFAVVLLAVSFARAEAISSPSLKTGPGIRLDRTARAIALNELQRSRLGHALRTDRRQASADQGDISILRDDGTLIIPLNRFDLSNRSVSFTPRGSGYSITSGSLNMDAGAGSSNAVTLTDDDSEEVSLGFSFPFYGVRYTSVYLNTDGNLTLTRPDAESTERNLRRVMQGPPRIAPLFEDLNPAGTGSVRIERINDRFLIWWNSVPQYGTAMRSTFQVVLRGNGEIQFNYQAVNITGAVVGIAPGNSSSAETIDLSQQTGSAIVAGLAAEVFSATQQLDLVALSQAFYEVHQDAYDALIFFSDFELDLEDAFAYEVPVRNEVDGIMSFSGDIFDFGSYFGSDKRLAAILNMGSIGQYPSDPREIFLGTNNTLSIIGQEFGHRWLAFVDTNPPSMLGRDQAHWSFFMNTLGSMLEGNEIEDLGNNLFRTVSANHRYSPLDQYVMGLRSAAEVPPWFVVTNPALVSPAGFNCRPLNASCPPTTGVEMRGLRRNLTIQDVITTAGPRVPSSENSPKDFAVAFVLVTAKGQEVSPKSVERLERIRGEWMSFFVKAVENRATMATELKYVPVTKLELPLQRNGSSYAETEFAPTVQTGYSIVDSGMAVAVLRSFSNGHLVSEAAVPASPAGTRWFTYAERSPNVSTGIAIANPNDATAVIDFQLGNGKKTSVRLGPRSHLSKFVHEILGEFAEPFLGTLTIESSLPLAVLALRGTVNASGDFIIATIPLSSDPAGIGGSSAFPVAVDGGGYNTELILLNPGSSASSGSVRFSFDVDTDFGSGSQFEFSIPASGVWRLRTKGLPESVISGFATVIVAEGSPMPDATAMIRLMSNGDLKSETAVPAQNQITSGLMFAVFEPNRRTGIAIFNPGSTPLQVTLTPLDRTGAAVAAARTLTLASLGRIASFIDDLIAGLPATFVGTVLVESSAPMYAISLRGTTDSKNGFLMATLPILDFRETLIPAYLPQLVFGGEFTTELLVMSRVAGSVALQFFTTNGEPMAVSLLRQ